MRVRFSKSRVVLAIYGQSCVGKSTLADELGKRWAVPVRHCGSVVKTYANATGIPPDSLPLESHRRIDAETRGMAEETKTLLIIEGMYLDVVLSKMPHVRLLQLTCADRMREIRFHERSTVQNTSSMTLKLRDEGTAELRRNLYGSSEIAGEACMVLDTTITPTAGLEPLIRERLELEICDDEA